MSISFVLGKEKGNLSFFQTHNYAIFGRSFFFGILVFLNQIEVWQKTKSLLYLKVLLCLS